MILLNVKPCCYKCACPDIEVDTIYAYDRCDHPIMAYSTIYCSHAWVCKNYIESEE